MVHLSKTVFQIFYFRFRLVFIKLYIFVQEKASTHSLTLKRHNSFQNKNNRIATHSFAPRIENSVIPARPRDELFILLKSKF